MPLSVQINLFYRYDVELEEYQRNNLFIVMSSLLATSSDNKQKTEKLVESFESIDIDSNPMSEVQNL